MLIPLCHEEHDAPDDDDVYSLTLGSASGYFYVF